MAWRLAKSLEILREQVNAAYPKRSKVSDGTIGDAAHAATDSEHNPNAKGVVRALDLTHDPKNGLDIQKLADALRASRDPRIYYLIANGRIMVPAWGSWDWRPYSGSNPHKTHLHISVNESNYDKTTKWKIGEDMSKYITAGELEIYVRHWYGTPPSDWMKKNAIGNWTREETANFLRTKAATTKRRIGESKAGTLRAENHLPIEIRKVYKAPGAPKATKLKKGLYEVTGE